MLSLEHLPLRIRVVSYYLIYVLIWCVWCLPPLLSGDHAGFQAAGTVIISWAIFVIGRDRLRFEKAISSSEYTTLVAALNRLEAHRAINEKRLNLTFDIHQHQISTILARLKMSGPIGPNTKEDLEEFGKEIEAEIASSPKEYVLEEENTFAASTKDLAHARTEYGRWREYAFQCEIAFLVIGTLQTGYGAAVSEMLARSGIIAFLKSTLSLN